MKKKDSWQQQDKQLVERVSSILDGLVLPSSGHRLYNDKDTAQKALLRLQQADKGYILSEVREYAGNLWGFVRAAD